MLISSLLYEDMDDRCNKLVVLAVRGMLAVATRRHLEQAVFDRVHEVLELRVVQAAQLEDPRERGSRR